MPRVVVNPTRPGARTDMARRVAAGAGPIVALVAVLASGAAPARGAAPGGALPDTVLARIGADRDVTVSEFRAAWAQLAPPARPDSLTPETAERFLDLLVDREALGERALREAPAWTPAESLQFRGYRDNLVLRTFLDSLMLDMDRRRKAAGDTASGPQDLGVAVRESVLAGFDVSYDDALAARLAERWAAIPRPSPDSSMMAQLRMLGRMPEVDAADTGRVLASHAGGAYRVSDLLEHWRRTDPLARPHVTEASQVRDLAKNGLFERWLRAEAERARADRRPAVAAALAKRREYHAVTRLVQREVYDHLVQDSLTLHRWYEAHIGDYDLPERARIMQLVLPSRGAATDMYVQLRDAVAAESLLVRGRRAGAEYRVEVTAESDSALFRAARSAGAGAVLGPDSTRAGWRVARVLEVLASRHRTFEEARIYVQRQHESVEGERLMQEFLARVRKGVAIRRHPQAGRLAASGP